MKKAFVVFLTCLVPMVVLISLAGAAVAPDYIYLFDYRNRYVKSWDDKFEDGASTNAKIGLENYPDGKIAVIEGTSDKESFGCVYQDLTINLDKCPTLEIDVNSVTKNWYIIVQSDKLQGKETDYDGNQFVRIQVDTDRTGQHRYNFKELTGLSGEQAFRLKVGVATGDVYIPTEGVKMLFRTFRFAGTK